VWVLIALFCVAVLAGMAVCVFVLYKQSTKRGSRDVAGSG
jgi:hypothetical protein